MPTKAGRRVPTAGTSEGATGPTRPPTEPSLAGDHGVSSDAQFFLSQVALHPERFLLARHGGRVETASEGQWTEQFLTLTKALFDQERLSTQSKPMGMDSSTVPSSAKRKRARGLKDPLVRESQLSMIKLIPELLVDGFDSEQVWAQIQISHTAAMKSFRKAVADLAVQARKAAVESAVDDASMDEAPSQEEGAESGEHMLGTDSVDSREEGSDHDEHSEDSDDERDVDAGRHVVFNKKQQRRPASGSGEDGSVASVVGRKTVVDDRFFSLHEMEEFVKEIEALEYGEAGPAKAKKDGRDRHRRRRAPAGGSPHDVASDEEKEEEESDGDEPTDEENRSADTGDSDEEESLMDDNVEDIDFFQEIPSDTEDAVSDDEDKPRKNSRRGDGVTYEEFFGESSSRKRGHKAVKPTSRKTVSEIDEEDEDELEDVEEEKDAGDEEQEDDEEAEDEDEDFERNSPYESSEDSETGEGADGNTAIQDWMEDPDNATALAAEREGVAVGLIRSHSESKHAKRLRLLRESIRKLEAENLQPRPWKLQGEAASKNRPVNSLLDEDLEFEHASKTVPVITEQVTHTLEDMIKRRILDTAFDDVTRRAAAPSSEGRPRTLETLDETKSQKSLSEIYEEAFLKERERQAKAAAPADAVQELLPPTDSGAAGTNAQLSPEEKIVKRVEARMKQLFERLDELTNFHFRPQAPQSDVQVVANVPAIVVEEKVPTAVSDAARLAPEELYKKPRVMVSGPGELSAAEKKRLRDRAKKQKRQKTKDKESQQLARVVKANPGLGNKYAKERTLAKLDLRASNIKVADSKDAATKYTSSASVFKALQDRAAVDRGKSLAGRNRADSLGGAKAGSSGKSNRRNIPKAVALKL